MRVLPLILIAALLGILAAGCAKKSSKNESTHNTDISSGVRQAKEVEKLQSRAVAAGRMTISPTLDACDEASVIGILDQNFLTTRKNEIHDLWQTCQAMYACSPSTQRTLKTLFASGANFTLDFADLKEFSLGKLKSAAQGRFVPPENIYLDSNIGPSLVVCSVLLHEITHFFDPRALAGEESLRVEYAAYWNQAVFNEELLKGSGGLGEELRVRQLEWLKSQNHPAAKVLNADLVRKSHAYLNFLSKEQLFDYVVEQYGFEPDRTVLEGYEKLPREP